jgi:hypothetical protein
MICCHQNRKSEGRGGYAYPNMCDECDCGGFKKREQFNTMASVSKEVGWDAGIKKYNLASGEEKQMIFYKPKV